MHDDQTLILQELRQISSLLRRIGAFFICSFVLFVIPACIFLLLLWREYAMLAGELEKLSRMLK